jgi:hypothetical protein
MNEASPFGYRIDEESSSHPAGFSHPTKENKFVMLELRRVTSDRKLTEATTQKYFKIDLIKHIIFHLDWPPSKLDSAPGRKVIIYILQWFYHEPFANIYTTW